MVEQPHDEDCALDAGGGAVRPIKFEAAVGVYFEADNSSGLDFQVLPQDEAAARRRELRTSTGGRKSKYSPVGDQLMNLKEGQVLSFNLAPNQIISLRNYVNRNFPEKYKVTTRRVSDEQFEAHVSAAGEGTAPKRRGRAKKAAA